MPRNYLFTSQRLGFRNWQETDVEPMAAINADPDVMEFFPGTKTLQETKKFIERMQQQMGARGYCYFAVDKLEDGAFIGFIGLSYQTYEADFNPCVDIGWRLRKNEWNKGFATEGAKRSLDYGLNELGLNKINCIAPKINLRSENVMKKIGMTKVKEFIHPMLLHDDRLRECVLYEATKD